MAVRAFDGRTRKGSPIPYVTHLFAVAALVGEYGGDEDQIVAGLLHDYLEDIPGSRRSDLSGPFGERVAEIVEDLTDATTFPKPPWRARKEAHLRHVAQMGPSARLVGAADKFHNITTLVRDVRRYGPSTIERFSGGRAGTVWYYRAMADALGQGWDGPLLDEVRTQADALEGLLAETVSSPSAK